MKAHLCKCNNCDNVLIDQNSQIGAKEHDLKGSELEMQYHQLGGDLEYFWACPICLSDEYLTDL